MGIDAALAPRQKCRAQRGQALMELAVGLFALSLVLAALIAFTSYILSSLDMQRTIRREAGTRAISSIGSAYSSSSKNDTIEVDSLAAEYVFGKESVHVHEQVQMPAMGISLNE